jgi:hypothetical protein
VAARPVRGHPTARSRSGSSGAAPALSWSWHSTAGRRGLSQRSTPSWKFDRTSGCQTPRRGGPALQQFADGDLAQAAETLTDDPPDWEAARSQAERAAAEAFLREHWNPDGRWGPARPAEALG